MKLHYENKKYSLYNAGICNHCQNSMKNYFKAQNITEIGW